MRSVKGFGLLCFMAIAFVLSPLAQAQTKEELLTRATRDVEDLEQRIDKDLALTDRSPLNTPSFIVLDAGASIRNAKNAGANTALLEKRLAKAESRLHEQNLDRVLKEMEEFGKLPPDSNELGGEIEVRVQTWRWSLAEARRAGKVSVHLEERWKDLEHAAFERAAQHALKEYADFVACRPSRFAGKGRLYGWNAYYDALKEQTKLPIMIVWALQTPNAGRIEQEYRSLEYKFSEKFFSSGPAHGMGAMADYGDVCGKELEKHLRQKN